jgi:hypothetical protein
MTEDTTDRGWRRLKVFMAACKKADITGADLEYAAQRSVIMLGFKNAILRQQDEAKSAKKAIKRPRV